MRALQWLAPATIAVLSGCTPYSFSGGRTALVRSVAVPIFENETTEFGLSESLTRGVIDGFIDDNQIKVVDADAAEALLAGRIVEYQRKAYTFDENDQVQEYIVEIWVSAELTKKSDGTALWTVERMRGYGTYRSASADGAETEQKGQERAIARIAEDLLNRTIKSW